MKILYFEARKGILRRYVLIALAVFLCLNIFKIYADYRAGNIRPVAANVGGMQAGYSQIYRRARGPITGETAGFVSSEYRRLSALTADGTYSREQQAGTYSGYLFGDFYLFHKYFYPAMEYSLTYPAYMEGVLERAEENEAFYREKGNLAFAAQNAYILRHYEGRAIPEFYSYDGWEALLAYDFSDLLILLLLILGSAPVFARERETGMTLILSSSKRGGWPLLLSKCGACIVFAFVAVLLFSMSNLLAFGALCGFEGGGSPIYAIESYQNTPCSGTILSFYGLCTALKAIGFGITTLVLTLLSACFQKALYPCLLGLGSGMVFSFFSAWATAGNWWQAAFALVSPLTLTRGGTLLERLDGLCVGGLYLPRLSVLLVVQAGVAGMLVLLNRRRSCCKLN